MRVGRIATISGILVGILTALIASGYTNIMDYIQLLFSFFNAPLFATFIIGMFWKRMTPWAGFWGLVAGTVGAAAAHYGNKWGVVDLGSAQAAAFWGAVAAFVADAIVTVIVSMVTQPKPIEELQGLVYGMANEEESRGQVRQRVVPLTEPARVQRARPDLRPQPLLHLRSQTWPNDPHHRAERAGRCQRRCRAAAKAANLFDLRRIIGGLFIVYGVILTILGITASDADIEKAAGTNVNLWTGLSMLVVAAVFIGWALIRPLERGAGGAE